MATKKGRKKCILIVEMTRGRAAFSLDERSPYLLWSRAQSQGREWRETRSEMQQEPLARTCTQVKEFGLYLEGKWEPQRVFSKGVMNSDLQFRRISG